MAASGITIRKAVPGDAKVLTDLFNEGLRRGFYKYNGTNLPMGRKKLNELRKRFSRRNKNNEFVFVAVDRNTGRIVGNCNFYAKEHGRERHRGEAGWGVHPDYARKGIGALLLNAVLKEAKRRGYRKVQAEAAVINTASVRLAKGCGFKIEGRRRMGLLLDNGRYADTYVFGKVL